MKRFCLIIGAILFSLALRAQSVTYTCRYWFDQNDAQAVTTTFSEGTWQAELDVGTLSKGLHTFHVQAVDTSSAWCSPLSYMFFKPLPAESLFDSMDMSSLTYHCWFDHDDAHKQTGALGNGSFLFDVDGLEKGLHTIHIMLEGSTFTSSQSYMFFKLSSTEPLLDSVDMNNLTYHCWFDHDDAHKQTGALGNGSFLFDVDGLEKGLHTIHIMLEGSTFTSSQSYMFLKMSPTEPLLDSVDMSNLTYHCWFDQDHTHQQTGSLGNGSFLFDVSELEEGLHSLNIMLEGSTLTSTQNYMFVKTAQQEPLIDPIDMSHLVYHCWFDQDYENHITDSVSNGIILLDVDNIADGMHTLHVMLEGEALTSIQTYMFAKLPQQNSLIEPIDMSNLVYHCWFDQDYENRITASISNGIMLLDVDTMSDGLHTVHILLEGEAMTSTLTYMFFIKPEYQDFGIAKWQYFLNGNLSQIYTTEFSPLIDSLDIVTLLPVETWPVRSSCFHFHPNGDEPYLNAKNEVIFRFWSNDDRVLQKSAFYIDYQVQQDIVANVFERNTTETFAAPRDNQIQWFKLDVGIGDSLAFVADKASTIQLFAPSGEEVYTAMASEALILGGCYAWEDGTYYLAVHDVTGSGDTISVTYQYVHKFAVLAQDVHLVGNGGCSTITFQGNGFNSLLDVYLVNGQNDTISRLDIGHESNSTTTVTFNFYEVNLGIYDAVFQFYDETIRINGALEVQEPVDIVLSSTMTYPSQFFINTPCTYTYTITNNGNMSAYVVPIYVYLASQTLEGISHLEIDGFDLPSIIDGVELDSLSESAVTLLTEWAKEMGEDHFFFRSRSVDEATGDSVHVRSNFFFMRLAPFETKTITIKIISDEPISVYVTVPNDIVEPLTLVEGRGFVNQYCCVQEKIHCVLNIINDVISIVNSVTSVAPGTPIATIMSIASCVSGIANNVNSAMGSVLCEGGDSSGNNGLRGDFWNSLNTIKSATSIIGSITSCLSSFLPGGGSYKKAKDIVDIVNDIMSKFNNALSSLASLNPNSNDTDCKEVFTKPKPGCPPGTPQGGPTTPVFSLDPNDIHGYLSESGSHYMRQEIQNIHYEIEFENDTTLATAAAHTIIVRDTLDATRFDLNSLAAHSVTIGDKRLELNGEQNFARTLDMRPELYVIAQINQDYDPTTGIVEWTIQSLDPMTMEPTDNPYQGVLPVNYFGDGVGFIDYSINLKQAFADGTAINNRAGIIFDQNDVIMTPTWTNIVDAVKPTSYIEEVTFEDDTLNFSFVSSDNRSGVWYHSLYYRNDFTDMEWKVKVPKILENNYLLYFDEYQTTEYLVMAIDSAGNHEEKDMVAEYVYFYDGPEPVCQSVVLSQGWNWFSSNVEITLQDLKVALVDAYPNVGINSLIIKSNGNGQTAWNPTAQKWIGGLNTMDLTQMYMIKVAVAGEITLEGLPINPAEHPITIANGNNWIAFPLSESMTVTNAFAGFPANGDIIKSNSGGQATWNSTVGRWIGGLTNLNPGQGYIYKSNIQGDRTYTFGTNNGK